MNLPFSSRLIYNLAPLSKAVHFDIRSASFVFRQRMLLPASKYSSSTPALRHHASFCAGNLVGVGVQGGPSPVYCRQQLLLAAAAAASAAALASRAARCA
jgi:hypothetical protein